jgi:hypothetical protein
MPWIKPQLRSAIINLNNTVGNSGVNFSYKNTAYNPAPYISPQKTNPGIPGIGWSKFIYVMDINALRLILRSFEVGVTDGLVGLLKLKWWC